MPYFRDKPDICSDCMTVEELEKYWPWDVETLADGTKRRKPRLIPWEPDYP